jgi:uncharacterized protein DUF5677
MTISRAETGAYPALLNRQEAAANIARYFSEIPEVIASLVDYGTYLIPRCLESSGKKLSDLVALGVLAKQAVVMLDGSQLLLKEGAVQPSSLQLRALFEVSVYIDWMVHKDEDERARAYYTWNLRRKRTWARRAIKGSDEAFALAKDMEGLALSGRLETEQVQHEASTQLAEIEQLLNSADYQSMSALFDARRGKSAFDPEWYAPLLPKSTKPSLTVLCREVGRMAEYRIIYELGSESMHSSRSDIHLRVIEGKAILRPLRDLTDIGLISQLIMGEAMHVYIALLDRYRPQERETFSRKYQDAWRAIYLNPKSVKYEYHE